MNAITGMLVGLKLLAGVGQTDLAKPAWELLAAGRLNDAATTAREALERIDSPDLHHILFNVEFLRGDFGAALEQFEQIPPGYPRMSAIDETAIHAYRELGRHREALDLARELKRPPGEIWLLETLAARPFAASLGSRTVVPFADHPLTPYFPAFHVSINGQDVVAHVDTGGNYLIMGPKRAEALGIDVRDAGSGFHGARAVSKSLGIVESFTLGDAALSNVPVVVLASLSGESDFVIFGTNVLGQFLSTLDYPNQRLILSPRGDAQAAIAHTEMLTDHTHEVPFYVWSDHYLLAPGGLGDRTGWFFVDSGLVMILEWQGAQKQAALLASKAQFAALGIGEPSSSGPVPMPAPLGLHGLPQDGHIGAVGDACPKDLGGVKISGLLSHAYLKQYSWTIDFDRRMFVFSTEDARTEN